ncbi:hypothetical protein [Desulfosporosinus sp. SB140]|uniref:hypothetical protein n=1 Tax=Desulfosporosinus paludis TaxID=3115649 RepID=UPI00388E3864
MSILKLSSAEVHSRGHHKVKQGIFINVFLITTIMLCALDLLVASIRGDSLASYTKYVLIDLILTVVSLFFCSDLIIKKERKVLSFFLSYMLFLWSCLAIIKLVCLT